MRWVLFLLIVVLAASSPAQTASYGHNDKYLLPDRGVTPGAVNPSVVGDPSGRPMMINGVEANICAKDFSIDPYKKSTEAIKQQVCAEYGGKVCSSSEGAIDYLIPLEIGGEDSIRNLWWVPKPDYDVKDHEFNGKLKPMVCSGKIALKTAQALARNWVNGMWGLQIMEKCEKCTVTVAPNIKVPPTSEK